MCLKSYAIININREVIRSVWQTTCQADLSALMLTQQTHPPHCIHFNLFTSYVPMFSNATQDLLQLIFRLFISAQNHLQLMSTYLLFIDA